MLNSLVNSLSIWQSEHGRKSMKSDPVKYKNVRQLLMSDLETRRNVSNNNEISLLIITLTVNTYVHNW